jgi:multicomponent Na+:H+ antiporter subunit G
MAVVSDVFFWLGLFFITVAAVGLLRMPDFYSRAHAVSKTESMGLGLLMLGLALHEGASLVSLKLVMVVVFVFLANPVGVHLLTRTAFRLGVLPWTRESGERTPGSGGGGDD